MWANCICNKRDAVKNEVDKGNSLKFGRRCAKGVVPG